MSKSWCRVCGKEYKVCDHCETARNRTPWRIITDTPVHYQIWVIVYQYKSNLIDRNTAREMLLQVPFKMEEIQSFIPSVREIIEEIIQPKKEKPEQIKSEDENVSNVSKKTRRRGRT